MRFNGIKDSLRELRRRLFDQRAEAAMDPAKLAENYVTLQQTGQWPADPVERAHLRRIMAIDQSCAASLPPDPGDSDIETERERAAKELRDAGREYDRIMEGSDL